MTTKFQIPIVWSRDGLNQCEYFAATTAKTLTDVQKAYNKAKKKFKALDPEQFVCDYEDSIVPQEVIDAAEKAGLETADLLELACNKEDTFTIYPEAMAQYVCRFIMLVDPDLKLELQKEPYQLQAGHIG